jgi:hypothetical protein
MSSRRARNERSEIYNRTADFAARRKRASPRLTDPLAEPAALDRCGFRQYRLTNRDAREDRVVAFFDFVLVPASAEFGA